MGNNCGPDILLIQPPLPANSRHKKVLPLGLAYLASYLRRSSPGVNIEICDCLALNMRYDQALREALRKKRDIIGVTFWTAQAPFAYSLSRDIKKRRPDTAVIFGGVHTTCCPEEASGFSDYCVLHEGEETFAELLDCIRSGEDPDKIKGLAYRQNGEFIRTSPRPFIEDLDSIPFPALDLLPIERYDSPLHVVGGRRIPIVGSRGCLYNCSFCVSPYMWKRQVRWRSAENVVSEIREVIERYGIKQFHFWDDNMLMNKEYIEGLCNRIIDSRLDIKWVGITRGSHVTAHPGIVRALKESGCVGLEIGIESADPNTFLKINKEEDLKNLEEACRLQKEQGMYPLYTYMSLNPGENINTYYFQARFIDRILSGLPWYEFFHPLPFPVYIGQFCTPHIGTELRKHAGDLGLIVAKGLDEYNHHTVNFIPYSLSEDIPQRTIKRLRDADFIICTKAAWYWIYELYPDKQPLVLQAARRCGFLLFLSEFFALCNGRMNIREISSRLSLTLGLTFKKSIQYCAIITITLSQLGVIRSAIHDTGIEMELKEMNIPDYARARGRYRLMRIVADMGRIWAGLLFPARLLFYKLRSFA